MVQRIKAQKATKATKNSEKASYSKNWEMVMGTLMVLKAQKAMVQRIKAQKATKATKNSEKASYSKNWKMVRGTWMVQRMVIRKPNQFTNCNMIISTSMVQ